MENSAFSQFGSHVFDDRAMRARLPQEVYQSLRRIRDEGEQWDPRVADVVADAMKNWAMQLGATHYIHWFIPVSYTHLDVYKRQPHNHSSTHGG